MLHLQKKIRRLERRRDPWPPGDVERVFNLLDTYGDAALSWDEFSLLQKVLHLQNSVDAS